MSDTKQVIVMRRDLNMRKGKMIAQGAHASMAFITTQFQDASPISTTHHRSIPQGSVMGCFLRPVEIDWLANSFTKITVSVNSEDELLAIHAAAEDAGLRSHLITDNGLTEFGGVPTRTCLAIGPDRSDKIDRVTGDLRLL